MTNESQIGDSLIAILKDLKYTYREDIRDRASDVVKMEKKVRGHLVPISELSTLFA